MRAPVTLVFTRFALGTAVLFLILAFRRERLVPTRPFWPALALMGFVGGVCPPDATGSRALWFSVFASSVSYVRFSSFRHETAIVAVTRSARCVHPSLRALGGECGSAGA